MRRVSGSCATSAATESRARVVETKDRMNIESERKHEEWLIVLRPDGVVESVEGGAPVVWLGHTLADAAGVSDDLRLAALDVMRDVRGASYVRRRKLRLVEVDREVGVELLLVEGVPLRRAHTRIGELVMRTLDVFASQAHSSEIDLTVKQAPDVPMVLMIDGEKIAWALATLVANALRFAQQRDSKKEPPHIRVEVRWNQPGQELVIVVSDNGPGISEHRARWLFDRDPTTGKSAGLALLMVRDVIVAHRGSVGVKSSIGLGTTFTMRIPHLHI